MVEFIKVDQNTYEREVRRSKVTNKEAGKDTKR